MITRKDEKMEKILPIGSIVYLNEATQKIMIVNRGPQIEIEKEMKLFDYSGCPYPLGLMPEGLLYFNHENIDRVVFEGFSDEEEERHNELYTKWLADNKDTIAKGDVETLLEKGAK